MATKESNIEMLQKSNISPSFQRLMVLQYLQENQNHPTVEQIFNGLREQIPTLSKATVYNVLNVFLEAKLVRVLSVEENESRYDIVADTHGHFKCRSCGVIYNFAVDIDRFVTDDLRGFVIAEKNVYFHGVCPSCQAKE